MDKDEIQSMIDYSIKQEIKNHEVRVGWVSGIIGSLFVFGNCLTFSKQVFNLFFVL